MKKFLALALAFMLVLSLCGVLAITAEEEDDDENSDPSAFFWMVSDADFKPYINFRVDGSVLTNKLYNVRANVYFGEDCAGVGNPEGEAIFVNYYCYADEANHGDFTYLINFADFADFKDDDAAIGEWKQYSKQFNPYEATYAATNANTKVNVTDGFVDEVGVVTIGIGFWNAVGTVKVASVLISEAVGGRVIWTKGFAGGLDPEDEDIFNSNLTAEKEGANWGAEVPAPGTVGNIAPDATATYPTGYEQYTASLTDGIAVADQEYTNDWYAFYYNSGNTVTNTTAETIEGTDYRVGTVVFDFGSAKSWDKVRAHIWDGGGASGIAGPALVLVSYSDDGENWEEAGDLLLGDPGKVYWAEKEYTPSITSQYCKLQFCWAVGGVFIFVNEIEIIEAGGIIDPGEDSSAPDTSEPAASEPSASEPAASEPAASEPATSEPSTPETNDSGLYALAIIAAISLAGAVVIKRR